MMDKLQKNLTEYYLNSTVCHPQMYRTYIYDFDFFTQENIKRVMTDSNMVLTQIWISQQT